MKYLLHIDTSTDIGIVAVSGNGKLISHLRNDESRNHAGTLNIMIRDLLNEAKVSFDDLSAIAVCGGPGSYTGLRIGMATAKGLCYALDIPLISDNRLTLLANRDWTEYGKKYSRYISLLVARANEYFISIYDGTFACILPPQHVMAEQLTGFIEKDESVFISTDAPENVIQNLKIDNIIVNMNVKNHLISWAFWAFDEYKCNNIVNLSAVEPFYLKQVYTHK